MPNLPHRRNQSHLHTHGKEKPHSPNYALNASAAESLAWLFEKQDAGHQDESTDKDNNQRSIDGNHDQLHFENFITAKNPETKGIPCYKARPYAEWSR
jgi:hypothetical protein